ncbi:MAG: MFS transporter [bacterium]
MVAVGIGIFMATIDGSIVNVALPTLVRDLQTTFNVVQWVVLAYLLTQATLLLGVGRLADMKGKKPLYSGGFVVFTAGSVLCGLAPTVGLLIAARVVQAVGASMILALGLAIVTEAFPAGERGKALGVAGSTVSVGIAVGPTLGGLLIDALSWHWIFFVNLPVGIVGTWLAWRYVPDVRPAGGQQFDYGGAATLFAGLLALLLALTLGQDLGFTAPPMLALFAAFAVLLLLFIFLEQRHPQPMIDLRLFRNPLFSVNLVTGFMTFVAIAGAIILNPFYLELVLGYGPAQVGLMLSVVPIALGITAPISGSLSDRLGTRPITVVGLLILVLGYLTMSTLTTETSTFGFIVRFLPVGIGMGVFQSPNNSAVMGSAPRRHLGVASGLLAITRTLGQTTGIAVIGALWAARVFARAGGPLPGGATAAARADQVAGLNEVYIALVIFMSAALALGLWGLWRQHRSRRRQEPVPPSEEPVGLS